MTYEEAKKAMDSGSVVCTKKHSKYFPKNYAFVIKNLKQHGDVWWTFPKSYQPNKKNPIIGISQLKVVGDDMQLFYQVEKMKAEMGLK